MVIVVCKSRQNPSMPFFAEDSVIEVGESPFWYEPLYTKQGRTVKVTVVPHPLTNEEGGDFLPPLPLKLHCLSSESHKANGKVRTRQKQNVLSIFAKKYFFFLLF